MSRKNHWTLEEIREAYKENLKAYEILSPVHFGGKSKQETIPSTFDPGGDNFYKEIFPKKAKKILPKLKEIADKSGNVQIWRKGGPLNNLNQGMKERIEKGLKYGI